MGLIEHTPLAESERAALRRYADGLDEDWAIAILIGSAVWNIERLEAQLAGAVSPTWLASNEAFEVAWRGARSCGVGKVSPAQLTAALNALSHHLGGR